ncbi:MAG: flagellin [Chitinophagales bacterium]
MNVTPVSSAAISQSYNSFVRRTAEAPENNMAVIGSSSGADTFSNTGLSNPTDHLVDVSKDLQSKLTWIQQADKNLGEVTSRLGEVRNLIVQAMDDDCSDADRLDIQKEISKLTNEINQYALSSVNDFKTSFNIKMNKQYGGDFISDAQVNEFIDLSDVVLKDSIIKLEPISEKKRIRSIGDIDVTTRELASQSIGILDEAITGVSRQRASIGASINSLEHRINSLSDTILNLTAAESQIRDADMAQEACNYIKYSLQSKIGLAILTQAQQRPYMLLKLMKAMW